MTPPLRLRSIVEQSRRPSPAVTPQALAWHGGSLWIGSRDLRRVYEIDRENWTVRSEHDSPGIPWAAVSLGDALKFTLGEGDDDDRYLRQFRAGEGFARNERIACPDFTGSYLSYFDGHIHLSQWYKHRILELDGEGAVQNEIAIGAEICGQTFHDGMLYVLRGTEKDGESWRISRLKPGHPTPAIEDLAEVPFACRSLAFDGKHFWSNHRAADEIVSFSLPKS